MIRCIMVFVLLFLSNTLSAPKSINGLIIVGQEPINLFENVCLAVGMVESSLNPLAVNEKEGAYGIYQIRQIRLNDYFDETGIRFTLEEMFDPVKAKQVFMYYACRIGCYDIDRIIRKWNGSGKKTYEYLKKVRSLMK